MNTIRIKITPTDGQPVWFASGLVGPGETTAKHLAKLNRAAIQHGVPAKYELATEEEYLDYKLALMASGLRGRI